MNVKRFVGRNSREAMARVRAALGEDAVVLSNRACDEGVEILAMPASAVDSIAADAAGRGRPRLHESPMEAPARQAARMPHEPLDAPPARQLLREPSRPMREPAPAPAAAEAPRRAQPAAGGARAGMSTVSFEEFVRDRLARRQQELREAAEAEDAESIPVLSDRLPEPPVASFTQQADSRQFLYHDEAAPAEPMGAPATRVAPMAAPAAPVAPMAAAVAPVAPMAVPTHRPVPLVSIAPEHDPARLRADLMDEMKALRGFIGEQMSNIAFLDGVRRHPLQNRMLRRLLDNGFSAAVTRRLVSQIPADADEAAAERWLHEAVAGNLACDVSGSLLESGGVFALVGPTGVGKTTTTAKIAAQFALRHGTQSIGLITVDHYRVGAHDQLRAFGRILGVPVHTAHDAETLADFLNVFSAKKLVLIDTVGVGQRDERVQELLAALALPQIRKLVVLNAAAQAATIEDVVAAYRGGAAAGVVISKIDEAVTLGGVVDCAMRHRLRVVGVADGQRVPEDWHAMAAAELARRALEPRAQSVFSLEDAELPAMWAVTDAERAHA